MLLIRLGHFLRCNALSFLGTPPACLEGESSSPCIPLTCLVHCQALQPWHVHSIVGARAVQAAESTFPSLKG